MGHIFTQIRPLLERVQENVFDLTFCDIAVNLEQAFNSQSKANIEVHYAKESPARRPSRNRWKSG